MNTYTLNRLPTRETYKQIYADILEHGHSYIRKSLTNKAKGWMRRENLRWSFRTELNGRVRITPMKE